MGWPSLFLPLGYSAHAVFLMHVLALPSGHLFVEFEKMCDLPQFVDLVFLGNKAYAGNRIACFRVWHKRDLLVILMITLVPLNCLSNFLSI